MVSAIDSLMSAARDKDLERLKTTSLRFQQEQQVLSSGDAVSLDYATVCNTFAAVCQWDDLLQQPDMATAALGICTTAFSATACLLADTSGGDVSSTEEASLSVSECCVRAVEHILSAVHGRRSGLQSSVRVAALRCAAAFSRSSPARSAEVLQAVLALLRKTHGGGRKGSDAGHRAASPVEPGISFDILRTLVKSSASTESLTASILESVAVHCVQSLLTSSSSTTPSGDGWERNCLHCLPTIAFIIT